MRQTAAEIGGKAVVSIAEPIHSGASTTRSAPVSARIGLRLALYQPDIPQNTGAMLRLAACFGIAVDVIEPCGFLLDDRRLKRAALDYAAICPIARHASWAAFLADRNPRSRLVLMTTSGTVALHRFAFAGDDTILFGRESAGAPPAVHAAAAARVAIPLRPPARSLNVALAAAIALAEALRQTAQLAEL